MLTRLWQHRYYGLLATLLIGLAAAVLVMLLPDRQQAFARFMLTPLPAAGQGPQSLMDDQRLVNRVLQRLEIDSPNLIDPRPVDPVTAFKRNFGLRPTGTPGEFEVSYVSRSSDQAAKGVNTWLTAARDVWALDNRSGVIPSDSPSTQATTAGATQGEIEAARARVAQARDRQRALQQEQVTLSEQLASAQAARADIDAQQRQAQAELAQARQAQQAQQARQSELNRQAATQRVADSDAVVAQLTSAVSQAEKQLADSREAMAQSTAKAKEAASRLAQLQQEQTQALESVASAQAALRAAEAAKTDFAQSDAERARKVSIARAAQLDRQRVALETEIEQARDRRETLQREFAQTPTTVVEVVTDKEPVAQARDQQSRQALISKTKAELSELRVRFTDNHPDVRRQLAILSELESPDGAGNLIEAPTVGARPQVRPNPRYTELQRSLEQNQAQSVQLRERLVSAQTERERLLEQIKSSSTAGAGANPDTQAQQEKLAQARRTLAAAQAAANSAQSDLQQANVDLRATADSVQSAQADLESQRAQLSNAQQTARADTTSTDTTAAERPIVLPTDGAPTDAQLTQLEDQRQSLDQALRQAEQKLAANRAALNEADQQSEQEAAALQALQSAAASSAAPASNGQTIGVMRGGLTVVQTPLVVPASSNPDRTQWLFFGLLASLVLGAAVALVLGARRTAFGSIAELEQATGLRALGGVPRFSSSRQTMGFWLSAAWFFALLLIYGLVYLGFIALVDSGSSLLAPDWDAWRQTALGLLRDGASRLGVGEQWLAGLPGNE